MSYASGIVDKSEKYVIYEYNWMWNEWRKLDSYYKYSHALAIAMEFPSKYIRIIKFKGGRIVWAKYKSVEPLFIKIDENESDNE